MPELNPEYKLRIEELTTEGWTLIDNNAVNLTKEQCDAMLNEFVENGQSPNAIKAVLVDDPRYTEEIPTETGYIPID